MCVTDYVNLAVVFNALELFHQFNIFPWTCLWTKINVLASFSTCLLWDGNCSTCVNHMVDMLWPWCCLPVNLKWCFWPPMISIIHFLFSSTSTKRKCFLFSCWMLQYVQQLITDSVCCWTGSVRWVYQKCGGEENCRVRWLFSVFSLLQVIHFTLHTGTWATVHIEYEWVQL